MVPMSNDMSPELLVMLDRRRLGAVGVVRVTPGGRASSRESLFDPAILARVPWSRIGAVLGPRLLTSALRGRSTAS
jgi:hypothetical protein